MITSRIVGEIADTSFYVHPIFNEEFKIFQELKRIIFRGEFSIRLLLTALKQFTALFPFAYNYFFKHRLYVYGPWYLNIDIELSQSDNSLSLSLESDRYKQKGINISYKISEDTITKIFFIKNELRKLLKESGIEFEEVESNLSSLKLEDIYHPYKLFNSKPGKSIYELSNPLPNMYVFNTGLLSRAGGINPTASIFCLIEHHVENQMNGIRRSGSKNEFEEEHMKVHTI